MMALTLRRSLFDSASAASAGQRLEAIGGCRRKKRDLFLPGKPRLRKLGLVVRDT